MATAKKSPIKKVIEKVKKIVKPEVVPHIPTEEVQSAPVVEDLGTIEGSKILSVEKVGDIYKIQAANGCGYTLPESEYKAL